MIRAAALLMALVLTLPAAAQETARPPERPADPADTAPVESGAVEPPAADATTAAAPQPFGPPAPPVWFTLRESDARYDACRLALTVLGAGFRPVPAVTDSGNRDCGIARPLQVSRILPGIPLSAEPVLRCDTALSLALWTRDFVIPAAATLPDAPRLTGLETGPGYSCRERVGTGDADPKPSEHGYGNAIDVMGFRLDDGDPVPVQPRQGDGDPAESFQRAAQGTACLMFTTVLGPGSNAAHDDHLHLDIAARNSGWRLCE